MSFSNKDYQPKDFSSLHETDLGKQMKMSKIADKIRNKMPGINNIPAQLEKLLTELRELRRENEKLKEKI